MVNNDSFSILLQTVALFLPAWAIMVQIFARLMEDSDLDENPSLIPFFGVGLALTVVSIWLFGRAVVGVVVSHMQEQAGAGEDSQILLQGLLDVVQGEIAFTFLGLIILFITGIRYFKRWNGIHVLGVIVATIIGMAHGIETGPAIAVWLVIVIVVIDLLVCLTFWPRLRNRLREGEPLIEQLIQKWNSRYR